MQQSLQLPNIWGDDEINVSSSCEQFLQILYFHAPYWCAIFLTAHVLYCKYAWDFLQPVEMSACERQDIHREIQLDFTLYATPTPSWS